MLFPRKDGSSHLQHSLVACSSSHRDDPSLAVPSHSYHIRPSMVILVQLILSSHAIDPFRKKFLICKACSWEAMDWTNSQDLRLRARAGNGNWQVVGSIRKNIIEKWSKNSCRLNSWWPFKTSSPLSLLMLGLNISAGISTPPKNTESNNSLEIPSEERGHTATIFKTLHNVQQEFPSATSRKVYLSMVSLQFCIF